MPNVKLFLLWSLVAGAEVYGTRACFMLYTEVSGYVDFPVAFIPGERAPGRNWVGGRVSHHSTVRAGLEAGKKVRMYYFYEEPNP